ncbi:MAG TPA: hypothetical protein VKG38_14865 [Solirubrobacteraceae bacterium]|nr:hypothetical protein [Solirubrobacteraceae bacterium]
MSPAPPLEPADGSGLRSTGGGATVRRRVRKQAKRLTSGTSRRVRGALFNSHLVARILRHRCVLCLGDSHVAVMRDVHLPGVWFLPFAIGGATASGILNPNSKSDSAKVFGARLARAGLWQEVLLLLGEVDCGYLIWHRAARRGLTVDEQLELTMDAYQTFIASIVERGFSRVVVLSAPPPTIDDEQTRPEGSVADLRRSVTASKAERTELTLRFNRELRRRCETVGAVFVDVTTGTINSESGLLQARFRRAAVVNAHLAREPYSALIERQLSGVF